MIKNFIIGIMAGALILAIWFFDMQVVVAKMHQWIIDASKWLGISVQILFTAIVLILAYGFVEKPKKKHP